MEAPTNEEVDQCRGSSEAETHHSQIRRLIEKVKQDHPQNLPNYLVYRADELDPATKPKIYKKVKKRDK